MGTRGRDFERDRAKRKGQESEQERIAAERYQRDLDTAGMKRHGPEIMRQAKAYREMFPDDFLKDEDRKGRM